MNVVRQRGNGNTQGYRKLKNIQNPMEVFSHSDPNICTEDDTQFDDVRVTVFFINSHSGGGGGVDQTGSQIH
jgi:hypothetical protein